MFTRKLVMDFLKLKPHLKYANLKSCEQSLSISSRFLMRLLCHSALCNDFYSYKLFGSDRPQCQKYHTSGVNLKEKQNINVKEKKSSQIKYDCEKTSENLLETWFYEVSPYGSLNVNMPFKTIIEPLNPEKYPEMNKGIIELHYDNDIETSKDHKLPDPHQLSQISDMYKLDVSFDKDKANMNVSCHLIEGVNIPVCCILRIPLKYDLIVKTNKNESVSINGMESGSINVETEGGNINLRKIKSVSVCAVSKSGDIISKSTLLGNTDLRCAGFGMIYADKLQGSNITCSTEMGGIDVKSLYAQSSSFKTVVGNIGLGQCHGQVCVSGETSNLEIGSLEGDLDVGLHQGSVSVLLSHHNKVDIDLKTGDIDLSFPEGAKTDVTLSCPAVTVADNVMVKFEDSDDLHFKEGCVGGESGEGKKVNARTMSGTIRLEMLDWIKTTKLAFMDA